jgi:hypothetical protein
MRLAQPVNTASIILFMVGVLMILYGGYYLFEGNPHQKTSLSWGGMLVGWIKWLAFDMWLDTVPYMGKSLSLKQLWAFVVERRIVWTETGRDFQNRLT